MPTNIFGTVRQKIFDGKTCYPLVCIKVFDTPNFLQHLRDAHELFWHCETKNFRRKNVIPPFSSIYFFETKNFLKNSRIFLRKFWALWDIKISTGNRDMPPLIHKFFSIPEIFRKTEGFLYKAFRFGPVRQKFRQNRDAPLLFMKIFDKRIFLKHQSVLQWNISIVRQKFRRKIVILPPPPYPNFFDTRNYCNNKGFPYKIFRQWDKKFSTENLDTPPLLFSKFFRDQKLVKH